MNGLLNVWLFDIRVRIMGILPNLYSSLICLLCYPQSQSSLMYTMEDSHQGVLAPEKRKNQTIVHNSDPPLDGKTSTRSFNRSTPLPPPPHHNKKLVCHLHSPFVIVGNLRFKTTFNGYGWTSTRDLGWAFLRMRKSYGMAFCLPSCFTTVSFDSFSRRSQRSTTCDFKGENFVCCSKK